MKTAYGSVVKITLSPHSSPLESATVKACIKIVNQTNKENFGIDEEYFKNIDIESGVLINLEKVDRYSEILEEDTLKFSAYIKYLNQ
jgi:hypothetical protein